MVHRNLSLEFLFSNEGPGAIWVRSKTERFETLASLLLPISHASSLGEARSLISEDEQLMPGVLVASEFLISTNENYSRN